ncbi:MAG: FAD/NAD(P)-binding protein [Nitrospirae bacterium]|nr:FAD/NAD(P)-binding protein [Nitrospirota bacterium]
MNRLKPVKARIQALKKQAHEVKTYTLTTENLPFSALPGQFNMVGFPGVGEAPISFSALVRENCFEHTIRSAGRVTAYLDGLKEGDELFIRGPYGKGWPLRQAEGKTVLLIAGGLGIAPLRPVIQGILEKRGLFDKVYLIYGAKNEKHMLFTDEFQTWEEEFPLFLALDEISNPDSGSPRMKVRDKRGWEYHIGLVTDMLDKVKIYPQRTIAFVCGPEIMMRFVCRGLLLMGIESSSLYVSLERRMKCGIAHCGHCQHYGLFVCKDGPVFSYKQVRGLPDGLL